MKNIFDPATTAELTARINKLTPDTIPVWGKMDAAQMMAHCCVTYEFTYEPEKHPKPGFFMKLILKYVVKSTVCGDKPYTRNLRTAPAFLITTPRNFEAEKTRLLSYLDKTQKLGESHFDGKESHSFGKLTIAEWNSMFYKHLDHHLTQFGV